MKRESEEKEVSDQLRMAVEEASSLHTEREGVMREKRGIERCLREINSKIRHIVGQIKEKESEKCCLETTRDNCIAL